MPLIGEGSEHLVYLEVLISSVVKLTRPGLYGDSYYLINDLIHQRQCTPLEYLIRLRLWKRLFFSAPVAHGISNIGQIVTVHEFITGTMPTQQAVDAFLTSAGLVPVKQSCWLWKKAYSDFEIWVGDARCDNFVESPSGIVPIDLRLWQP